MSSYGPFYLLGAALSALSAYAQVPPGPGKFLEHEVSITTTAFSGCQLGGTPPRITGLKISEASATFKIPQVFAANCPLLANAQLEIDLIPQFPSLPPAALRVASLPSGGGTNVDLRTPMPTAMAAKIKARADRFNRVAMVSAHGFDGFTRSRDCYVEKLDGFPVPAGGEASGEIASQCNQTVLPSAGLTTIDGTRYYRGVITTMVGASLTSIMSVSVVIRSTYLWEADPPPPVVENLSVGDDIRVLQAIQVAGNKVPLIPLKSTVIRAAVSYRGARTFASYAGRLNAYRGGFLHSLSPVAAAADGALPSGRTANVDEDDTAVLHFIVPKEWTVPGTWEYEVELVPDAGFIDTNIADNKRRVTVEYEFPINWPRRFTIGIIPVSRLTFESVEGKSVFTPPDEKKIAEMGRLIQQLLPVSDGNVVLFQLTYRPIEPGKFYPPNSLGLAQLSNAVRRTYRRIQAAAPWSVDQVAFLTGSGMFPAATSDPTYYHPDGRGRTVVVPVWDNLTPAQLDQVLAHELGHNLGQRHTHTGGACPGYPANIVDDSNDLETKWPYPTDPTIRVAGWNHDTQSIVPRTTGELMAYCPERWVSPYSFEYLFRSSATRPELNSGDPPRIGSWPARTAAPGRHTTGRTAAGEDLMVSGWISADGSKGELDPAYILPADPERIPPLPDAENCIVLSGADGELGRHCFRLNFRAFETGAAVEQAYFIHSVPLPEGVTRVSLVRAGAVLATLAPGSAKPAVRILEPVAGAVWDGGSRTFRWEASDADGDKLLSSLMFSGDAGQTWTPLDDDTDKTQLTVDAGKIPGGPEARWRVYVTDGLNTSFAEAGPFEVRHQPLLEVASTLDFGATRPGSRLSSVLTLRNAGNGTLRVIEIRSSDARFNLGQPPFPLALGPGARLDLPLHFLSPAAADVSAILTLLVEGPREHTVTLVARSVAGAAPSLAVSPAALDFGLVAVGQSARLPLRVRNTGTANLNVSSVAITGARFQFEGPSAFSVLPAAEREVAVLFAPNGAGAQSGSLRILSNDPARASVDVALRGATPGTGEPTITVSPALLDFGSLLAGSIATMAVTIRNTGAASLTVTEVEFSNPDFAPAGAPALPITIAAGGELLLQIRFTARTLGPAVAAVTIRSNDPRVPSRLITLLATVLPGGLPADIVFSDNFNRSAADPCALGGSGGYFYLPLFGAATPAGAAVDGASLAHRNQDYGGVQFNRSSTPCANGLAADLGQNIRIKAELLVPRTGANVSQAGPFFRARTAFRGDGLIGGANAGYWVQLASTGEVTVKNLNTAAIAVSSPAVAGFDAAVFHTLEVVARETSLEVFLDGSRVLAATIPVTAGTNNGAAGLLFGAESNRGAAGGQKADNLVVSRVP